MTWLMLFVGSPLLVSSVGPPTTATPPPSDATSSRPVPTHRKLVTGLFFTSMSISSWRSTKLSLYVYTPASLPIHIIPFSSSAKACTSHPLCPMSSGLICPLLLSSLYTPWSSMPIHSVLRLSAISVLMKLCLRNVPPLSGHLSSSLPSCHFATSSSLPVHMYSLRSVHSELTCIGTPGVAL